MTLMVTESTRYQYLEDIAELTMQGLNPTQISKKLGVPRKEVISLQADYRQLLVDDSDARDMARDHLNQMVKHYDILIKKFYDLIDDIDTLNFSHQVAGQKGATLKSIAELEAKRLDALQKAGLLDSAELGDELAEMEEKQAVIIDILRNDLCNDCRFKVAHKLSKITGQSESIDYVQDGEIIDG